MADNSKIFLDRRQKVLDQIVAQPYLHDQKQWETSSASCGTQRCVAGWAMYFETPGNRSLDLVKYEFARNLGVEPRYFIIGKELLGLNDAEAYELFYEVTNDEAVDLLRQYARGETDVLHTEDYDPDYTDEGE
jgi:hypothetical protein